MLRYVAHGKRYFGMYPVPVHQRDHWEFFAVVRGRCGMTTSRQAEPLRDRYLWVTAPGHAHGWTGESKRACRVVVFHFGVAPPLLDRLLLDTGLHGCPLTPALSDRLIALATELEPHLSNPTPASSLHGHRALLDLSLMALRNVPAAHRSLPDDRRTVHLVETVEHWYREHLQERPNLKQMAALAHVSGSHLRRLFWRVRGESPQAALTRIRLTRATELLLQTDDKLDAIAADCGYVDTSYFCRSFRKVHGISPDGWRRRNQKAG